MCVCKGQKGGNTVTAWWHARRAHFDAAGSFWKLNGKKGNVFFKGKKFENARFKRRFLLAFFACRGKNFFILTLGGIKRWKVVFSSFWKELGMFVFKKNLFAVGIKSC